jgi:hypothetical protein
VEVRAGVQEGFKPLARGDAVADADEDVGAIT